VAGAIDAGAGVLAPMGWPVQPPTDRAAAITHAIQWERPDADRSMDAISGPKSRTLSPCFRYVNPGSHIRGGKIDPT
jgi:hypothetical protein